MVEDHGALRDSGYEVEEPVCEDGWGRLYRGVYAPHGTGVLLRVFPPALSGSDAAWALMEAEVQAWARLDHPGIIQVLDWGRSPGLCYVSAVLPGGRPMAETLSCDSGVEQASSILESLLAAVEAARSRGVLHLGLSPHNIWIEHAAGDRLAGRPVTNVSVGEFGFWYVAREFPELGLRGAAFPAPEQLADGRASSASDVFTLAVLSIALEHGLTAAREAAGRFAPPAGAHPALARCLERAPLARYRSAGELASALGVSRADEEPCARRDCPICQLKERIQREQAGRARGPSAVPDAGRGVRAPAGCFWALVATLVVAVALVWWMVLR